MSQVFQQW